MKHTIFRQTTSKYTSSCGRQLQKVARCPSSAPVSIADASSNRRSTVLGTYTAYVSHHELGGGMHTAMDKADVPVPEKRNSSRHNRSNGGNRRSLDILGETAL